jgi:hypothetical protein
LIKLSIKGKKVHEKNHVFWSNWKNFTLREDSKSSSEMAPLPIPVHKKLINLYGISGPEIRLWNFKKTHGLDFNPI